MTSIKNKAVDLLESLQDISDVDIRREVIHAFNYAQVESGVSVGMILFAVSEALAGAGATQDITPCPAILHDIDYTDSLAAVLVEKLENIESPAIIETVIETFLRTLEVQGQWKSYQFNVLREAAKAFADNSPQYQALDRWAFKLRSTSGLNHTP